MNLLLRLLLLLGVVSTSACHFSFSELPLNFTEERSQEWSLEGVTELHIVSKGGNLELLGQEGATDLRLDGVAKASSQEALDNLRMVATREGGTLRLEPVLEPEMQNVRVAYEMRFELPRHLALTVNDGSGSICAEDVASIDLHDGSGSIQLERVAGDVNIKDSSGSISLFDVGGNVTLTDGSGSISLNEIGGSVTLSDGSGSTTVTSVRGSVRVLVDGSGSITITGVHGDVEIDVDGSGGITVSDIGGDVLLGPTGSGGVEHHAVRGSVILKG